MAVKNTCSCPHPPGGVVSCEPEQLAICRVRNGVAEGECVDPPDGMGNLSELSPTEARRYYNYALQHITRQQRDEWDPISPADWAVLQQGIYHNDVTGEEVRFRLPDELNLNSPSSASGSRSGSGGSAAPSRGTPRGAGSGSALGA
jgi:hypothetical protein